MRRPSAPEPTSSISGIGPGSTIEPPLLQGRWRLVRTLETTAAGVAFLAWDAAQRGWCTVEVARDEAGIRRLKRERTVLRELDHQAVDKVHLLAAEGPIVFSVRRTLHGAAAELAPLSPGHALRLLLEASDALSHAHERHQVHGALRPRHLRFDLNGRVVVTGWADRLSPVEDDDHHAHLAPEVRAGLPPTEASDLYGLGATLYTLLTGSARADLYLQTGLEGLPPGLRRVIGAVCARDPGLRPRSALELHEWLVTRMGSAETAGKEPWGPSPLPAGPPPTVVADAALLGLEQLLIDRPPVVISRDLRTPTSESMSASIDPAPRRGEPGVRLPYDMPLLTRKDPGFRDPFEPVDPADLPAYVDQTYASRDPARSRAWGPMDLVIAPPPKPAPRTGPSGLTRALTAAAIGLGSAMLGSIPVAWWATHAVREVSAARDLVAAVSAEAALMGPLAQSAADPGPLERAWFTFTDAPTPEHAEEVVRQASAVQHESLDPAHREAIVRLREALDRWDRVR